jgi:hypothetical protein
VATGDGGWQAPDESGWLATLRDCQSRWLRQIWAVRLGVWMAARAQGTKRVENEDVFRSALSPGSARAARIHDTVASTRFEHIIASDDARDDVHSDPWSECIVGRDFSRLTTVSVIIPRPGDARFIGEPAIVDRAVQAGAAVRIVEASPLPHTAVQPGEPEGDVTTLLMPGEIHEDLITWTRSIERRPVSGQTQPESVADADRHLREVLVHTESTIAELGLRPSSRAARHVLDEMRKMLTESSMLGDMEARHRDLLMRAAPVHWLCDLALHDESVTVSRSDHTIRGSALKDLDRAARHAMQSATVWSDR